MMDAQKIRHTNTLTINGDAGCEEQSAVWDSRSLRLSSDTIQIQVDASNESSEDDSWHTAEFSERQILPVVASTSLQHTSSNNVSDDELSDLQHPSIPMAPTRRQSDSNQSRIDDDKYKAIKALLAPIGYNFAASSILSDTLGYRGQHLYAFNWMLIMACTGIVFGIFDCGEVIAQRDSQDNTNNIKRGCFYSCCKRIYKKIKDISSKSALSRALSTHFRPLFYVSCYVGTLATGVGDLIQHKYNQRYKTEKPTEADNYSSGIILILIAATAIIYCLWACCHSCRKRNKAVPAGSQTAHHQPD